jgi:hypothetical protein
MASGVYLLKFKSGKFYIGKSNDIERRWKEHWAKFEKGTAAANMQQEFNQHGYPTPSVMIACHEDHIDILEANLIHTNWQEDILNTSRPNTSLDLRDEHLELLHLSTPAHCNLIIRHEAELNKLRRRIETIEASYKDKIRDLISGTYIESQERVNAKLNKELEHLRNRNWFQRLFNL